MTKIAFASSMNSVPWGGSEILWYEAAELLSQQGHSLSLCTPFWDRLPTPLLKAKVEWRARHCFDPASLHRHLAERIIRRVIRYSDFDSKCRWLRNFRPAIFCISNGNAFQGLDWMEAAVAEQVPFVTIAQAHAEFLSPSDAVTTRLISAFSNSKLNYFVARSNQRLVETQLGVRLSNACLIGNHSRHLPNDLPLPWPAQPDECVKLACVGRLHPASKGQDLLLQALSKDCWLNRDWQLSLFGVGPQEQSLRRLAELYGISDRVQFMGHTATPMKIWDDHHALVLPSRYEGTPLVLMEAMLAGRPVITTSVAGAADLIQHNYNGFLADAPTVEHLQRCLDAAWAIRSDWQAIGRAAHDTAAKRAIEVPAERLARDLLELAQ